MSNQPAAGPPAFLVLNGDLPSAGFLRAMLDLLPAGRIVVAADGAARSLGSLGIIPDYIIGDLDSLGDAEAELAAAGSNILRFPDQETGDLEKSLCWLLEHNIAQVAVVGATGGMPDHALGNFSVLARYCNRLLFSLHDDRWNGLIVTPRRSVTVPVSPGDRLSLVPLPAATITTQGLEWELAGERLAFGEREGVSNRTTGEQLTVTVQQGVLLLFHYSHNHQTTPNPQTKS